MSDTLVLDRIQTSLTRLRLPRIGEILESVMQAAHEGGKSYLSFLDDLLDKLRRTGAPAAVHFFQRL